MINLTDKQKILDLIVTEAEKKWDIVVRATREAQSYATDSEAKAENKYDTRGLEASYLAAGQAERAERLKKDIIQIRQLAIKDFRELPIAATALVKIQTFTKSESVEKWVFVLPSQGGIKVTYDSLVIQTISPDSPLGKMLIGKKRDHEFELTLNGQAVEHVIAEVY